MGKLSKSPATELASTTQAIFRELRESISNPNPEKVFFIREISIWRRPGLYRRQPNFPKQTLLSLSYVTTAGMRNGGPVLYYLSRLYKYSSSKVLLTGYQVEGTNDRLALEHRFVEIKGDILTLKSRGEQYDFSAHSGDSELKKVVKDFCRKGTERVFVMHGDKNESFAQWISEEIGVDEYASAKGELFTF